MDELKNRLPAYGQHFDCMAQLIRSGVTFKLLQHLLDRYIMMYRLECVEDVKIHYQTVARKIGADRRTIKNAIDDLLRMQFISISENRYRINIKTILGVVFAFDAIDKKDIDLQIEFSDALNDGDYDKLAEFGFSPHDENCLDNLSGSPIIGEMYKNVHFEGENVQKCTLEEKVYKNVHSDSESVQKCTLCDEEMYKNVHFSQDEIEKVYNFVQSVLRSNYSQDELSMVFNEIFDENCTENHKNELLNAIFGENLHFSGFNPIELLILGIFELAAECTKMYTQVYKNVHFGSKKCTKMYTSNKYINNIIKIKKEINKEKIFQNPEEADEKPSSFFENEKNDGGTLANFPTLYEQPSSFLKNAESDLEPNGHDEPSSEIEKNNYWQPTKSYFQSKKKSGLPYYRAETIQEYETDITKCVDRFDKLFIHYLLQIVHELYDRDEELDEDGLVVVEESDNLIGVPIPVERIYTDLVEPTLQAVDDTIKKGYVEIDGERINVTASLDLEKADLIIDWNTEELCSGQHYIFSYDKFKNPYAEELPVVKKRRRRGDTESRADDYLYMQKVLLMNELDNRWESLTPLELSVSKFLGRFFQFNDNFEIIGTIVEQDPITNKDIEKAEATKNELDLVRLYDLSAPVTFEDLIGCTLVGKTDKYGWMKIMNRMFSAEKIRYWNSMHGYTSAVDEADVNRLLDEFAKQSEQSEELSGS